jgi:hypothetical protein
VKDVVQTIETIVLIIATSMNLALREILYALNMHKDLLLVFVGFVLAIAWDRFKDWRRFETLLRRWVPEELQEIKNSLEFRLANLPESLREKVKIAQGGVVGLNPSELTALPIDVREPYRTDAWQTFIANGYASKLEDEVYKTLREAYTTLEGLNFIAGLATFQLVGSSEVSPFDKPTKTALYQSLFSQPLFTIASALPKVNAALKNSR